MLTMRTLLFALGLLCATAAAQGSLDVAGLPADAPLRVYATATPEALTIFVSMSPGWHLYAQDVGGGQPVAVTIERKSEYAANGALVVPAGVDGSSRTASGSCCR